MSAGAEQHYPWTGFSPSSECDICAFSTIDADILFLGSCFEATQIFFNRLCGSA